MAEQRTWAVDDVEWSRPSSSPSLTFHTLNLKFFGSYSCNKKSFAFAHMS